MKKLPILFTAVTTDMCRMGLFFLEDVTAEFTRPDYESIFQHSSLSKILYQARGSSVDITALKAQITW